MFVRMVVLASGLFAFGAQAADVTLSDAIIHPPIGSGDVAVGYVNIENTRDEDVAIVGVSAECCSSIELHTHDMHDGVMRMRKLEHVDIPANEVVSFVPGGLHLMLFGFDKQLKAGDVTQIDLTLRDGQTISHSFAVTPR